VSEINDAQLVAALRRQMTLAAARQIVAAGNLANASTPGFRAREVDFARTLDDSLSTSLRLTNERHIQAGSAGGPETKEIAGAAARRDGNTVQIDRELLEMTRATGEFARAQTALAAKFRLVRYAINEGK